MSALRRWSSAVALGLVLVGVACDGSGDLATTPSQESTVAVPPPGPAPSIQATVEAAVKAKVEAMPQTPTVTPLSEPPMPPGVIPLPTTSAPTTPTPEATIADSAGGIVAQVSNVVDGDTIDVVFADGSTDRVRLLGIDTPETFSANNSGEYGDITDTACLDRWGDMATVFASIMRGHP